MRYFLILLFAIRLFSIDYTSESDLVNYLNQDTNLEDVYSNCSVATQLPDYDQAQNPLGILKSAYRSDCSLLIAIDSLSRHTASAISRSSQSSGNTEDIAEILTGYKQDSAYDAVRGSDDIADDVKINSMNDYRGGSGLVGVAIRTNNNVIDIKTKLDTLSLTEDTTTPTPDRDSQNISNHSACESEFPSYFENGVIKQNLSNLQLQTFNNCLNLDNRQQFGFIQAQKNIDLTQESTLTLKTEILDATKNNFDRINASRVVLDTTKDTITDLKSDFSIFKNDASISLNNLVITSNSNNAHLIDLLSNQEANHNSITRSIEELKNNYTPPGSNNTISHNYTTNNYYSNNTTSSNTDSNTNNDGSTVKVDVTALESIMQSIADFLGVGSSTAPTVQDIPISQSIANFDAEQSIQTSVDDSKSYFQTLLTTAINNILAFDFGLTNLFNDLKGYEWQDLELRDSNNNLLMSITEQTLNRFLPFDFIRVFILFLTSLFSIFYAIRNFSPK